jgi:hypothetical protein
MSTAACSKRRSQPRRTASHYPKTVSREGTTMKYNLSLLLVLAIVGSSQALDEPKPSSPPLLDIGEVIKAYEANEETANQKYKGKAFTVNGTIFTALYTTPAILSM